MAKHIYTRNEKIIIILISTGVYKSRSEDIRVNYEARTSHLFLNKIMCDIRILRFDDKIAFVQI